MTYEELEAILAPRFAPGWPAIVGIPDAWVDLVAGLHNRIVKLDPNYKINQIKVKFNGLRFYTEHDEDFIGTPAYNEFHQLVAAAEEESYDL